MNKTITLTVLEGPNGGRQMTAPHGQDPIVGRGSTADFSVIDPRMSREHFKITSNEQIWSVSDLGSSNGTMVNDEEVEGIATLAEDDVILAGDTKFLVSFDKTDLAAIESVKLSHAEKDVGNRTTLKRLSDRFMRRDSS